MNIEEALTIELANISGLKVFPCQAQQDTITPYLVYELSSDERLQELTGHNGFVSANYEFNFYDLKYTDIISLKNLIIDEIHSWNFTNLGSSGPYCQQVTIVDTSQHYDDSTKLYAGVIEITINYQEV